MQVKLILYEKVHVSATFIIIKTRIIQIKLVNNVTTLVKLALILHNITAFPAIIILLLRDYFTILNQMNACAYNNILIQVMLCVKSVNIFV